MPLLLFDTHTHYDDQAFDPDRDDLLRALPGQGIGHIVNAGSSLASLSITLELAEKYPFIHAALGIHPSDSADLTEKELSWMEAQCQKKDVFKIVAIGEIGLDYYWNEPERDIQKQGFARQLALAKALGLPVIIHSREAAQDTMDMLRAHDVGSLGGVMHCFSYTVETARLCLDMNLHIGIGGVVSFKNARKLKEVAAYVPLERILLETDCPYLAPVPYRGKRNNSAYLSLVAQEIAMIKGIKYDEVVRQTTKNAFNLFGIK